MTYQPRKWGKCEQPLWRNQKELKGGCSVDRLERPSTSFYLQPMDGTCPAQKGHQGWAPHSFHPPAETQSLWPGKFLWGCSLLHKL